MAPNSVSSGHTIRNLSEPIVFSRSTRAPSANFPTWVLCTQKLAVWTRGNKECLTKGLNSYSFKCKSTTTAAWKYGRFIPICTRQSKQPSDWVAESNTRQHHQATETLGCNLICSDFRSLWLVSGHRERKIEELLSWLRPFLLYPVRWNYV